MYSITIVNWLCTEIDGFITKEVFHHFNSYYTYSKIYVNELYTHTYTRLHVQECHSYIRIRKLPSITHQYICTLLSHRHLNLNYRKAVYSMRICFCFYFYHKLVILFSWIEMVVTDLMHMPFNMCCFVQHTRARRHTHTQLQHNIL